MNMNDNTAVETLLADMPDPDDAEDGRAAARPRRELTKMMRKIPVRLTLEVGSANISLQDLMGIGENSVVELDTLAGSALVIKVNGTPIGRAEVVVAGENYGLKVIDLDGLDLSSLAS